MITIRTFVDQDGVDYRVERDDTLLWHRRVEFGRDKAHRAGGPAFVQADLAQRAAAIELLHWDEDIVELIGRAEEVPNDSTRRKLR